MPSRQRLCAQTQPRPVFFFYEQFICSHILAKKKEGRPLKNKWQPPNKRYHTQSRLLCPQHRISWKKKFKKKVSQRLPNTETSVCKVTSIVRRNKYVVGACNEVCTCCRDKGTCKENGAINFFSWDLLKNKLHTHHQMVVLHLLLSQHGWRPRADITLVVPLYTKEKKKGKHHKIIFLY